jgi:hypothetical protein
LAALALWIGASLVVRYAELRRKAPPTRDPDIG